MSDLIVAINNGVAVTTSQAIADGTGNQHKNVLELVRTYVADLQEFGGVAFETQPFETAGGTQQREVAILNEQQATLLLTYMRNNEIVRRFKKALVKAFYELAKKQVSPQFTIPKTFAQALALAAEQAAQIELQQAQLEAARPAIDHREAVQSSDDDISFLQMSIILQQAGYDIGRNTLMKVLRDAGVLVSSGKDRNQPTRAMMQRGYFRVTESTRVSERGNTYTDHVTYITGKGECWILDNFERLLERARSPIARKPSKSSQSTAVSQVL